MVRNVEQEGYEKWIETDSSRSMPLMTQNAVALRLWYQRRGPN